MGVTRRDLAQNLAKMLAVAAAVPQVSIAQTAGAQTDEDLQSAQDQMKTNLQLIAKVKLPMDVEPAFVFKA